MLERAPIRARSYGSFHGLDVEEELAITRIVAHRLWRLLERRHPQVATELFEEMSDEAIAAAADRGLEAALILQSRDRIRVEPCRQLLDCQRYAYGGEATRYYLLTRPGAEAEVIDETKLLMLAGIDLHPDMAAPDDEVPL